MRVDEYTSRDVENYSWILLLSDPDPATKIVVDSFDNMNSSDYVKNAAAIGTQPTGSASIGMIFTYRLELPDSNQNVIATVNR
ncbi:hypothetical protein D3C75_960610 [compost metagenome]